MPLTLRQRKKSLIPGAQKKIATRLGLSQSTVSQVMNGRTQLLRRETVRLVQEAIAAEIGAAVEEVFGNAA